VTAAQGGQATPLTMSGLAERGPLLRYEPAVHPGVAGESGWSERGFGSVMVVRPPWQVEVVMRTTHRWARFEVDRGGLQHTTVQASLGRHALAVLDRVGVDDAMFGVRRGVGHRDSGVRGFAGGVDAVDLDGVVRDGVHDAEDGSGRIRWRWAPVRYRRADLHGFRGDGAAGVLWHGLGVHATAGLHVGQRGGAELGDHRRGREVHRRRAPVPLGELNRVAGDRSDETFDVVFADRRGWRWRRTRRGKRLARARAGRSWLVLVRRVAPADRCSGSPDQQRNEEPNPHGTRRTGGHRGFSDQN